MNPNQLSEYRELKDYGVEVEKRTNIRTNHGSETAAHIIAKALVTHIGTNNEYIVNGETPTPDGGAIDCCMWGHPDRLSYAVELEHSPTQEVIDSKLDRYVENTPLDDMILINLNELPTHRLEMVQFIADELGLEP